MRSSSPSRAVIVLPKTQLNKLQAKQAHLLEIAQIAPNVAYLLVEGDREERKLCPFGVSIYLFANQVSWLYDPVDWTEYCKEITAWGIKRAHGSVTIPPETANKFRERLMPEEKARTPRFLAGYKITPGPITLLDESVAKDEHNFLIYKGWEPSLVSRLTKINKGSKVAASIGLFHKPMRDEIRAADPSQYEANLDRVAKTMLQLNFNRYRTYQVMRKRMQDREKTLHNSYGCNDPFHHLERCAEHRGGFIAKPVFANRNKRREEEITREESVQVSQRA